MGTKVFNILHVLSYFPFFDVVPLKRDNVHRKNYDLRASIVSDCRGTTVLEII